MRPDPPAIFLNFHLLHWDPTDKQSCPYQALTTRALAGGDRIPHFSFLSFTDHQRARPGREFPTVLRCLIHSPLHRRPAPHTLSQEACKSLSPKQGVHRTPRILHDKLTPRPIVQESFRKLLRVTAQRHASQESNQSRRGPVHYLLRTAQHNTLNSLQSRRFLFQLRTRTLQHQALSPVP